MKTYKWSFVGKSDYVFFYVTVRFGITILGVFGKMLRLFYAFWKHYIANALIVTVDGDQVRLSFVKRQLFGVPLTCPSTNHRQLEELFVILIVKINLKAGEKILNLCVLKSNNCL